MFKYPKKRNFPTNCAAQSRPDEDTAENVIKQKAQVPFQLTIGGIRRKKLLKMSRHHLLRLVVTLFALFQSSVVESFCHPLHDSM